MASKDKKTVKKAPKTEVKQKLINVDGEYKIEHTLSDGTVKVYGL